jgi:hypothetical protein
LAGAGVGVELGADLNKSARIRCSACGGCISISGGGGSLAGDGHTTAPVLAQLQSAREQASSHVIGAGLGIG